MKVVLYSNTSSSFEINLEAHQGFILGFTLFLIIINDFADVISAQLRIYADDTNFYSVLNRSDKVKRAKKNKKTKCPKQLLTEASLCLNIRTPLKRNSYSFIVMADANIYESKSMYILRLTFSNEMG